MRPVTHRVTTTSARPARFILRACLAGFFLCFAGFSYAQNGLNSIYSAYGIGDVQLRDYNGYYGMGGLGAAMPSITTLNENNPASYGYLPHNRMMMELSFGGKTANYVNSTQNVNAGDFTIQKATMGFSLFKNWGTAFGLRKYSTVDYMTSGSRFLIGTDTKMTSKIDGTGGLNQFFFSNGVRIKKHLNLGLSLTYLSGSVNRKETVDADVSSALTVDKNTYYGNFVFNAGAQYQFRMGKWKWIAGGTYQPERRLTQTIDNSITDASGNTLVKDESVNGYFDYPSLWSAGLTMYNDNWKFGADYIRQNWNDVNYKGSGFQTTNSNNYSAGLSYTQPRKTIFGYMDGPTYSVGVNLDQSYLIIDGTQVVSVAGTAGISLPSRSNLYHYHFAIKAGQRGTSTYPLVKETFVEFNFNVSLASLLFTGGEKYR
ncbi:hypothetical protein [Flavihumibacter petaseus]|uniref:Outer membrane protein n=1 Tax=Flavihumibacter petaseus NBRC 106054 TaxID=1220578 RepID=A0A0E9N2B6_9BACT|nr:hypothetical protein [Flavihumibacter petaseus]GAO44147.1 hypothetical protein FPE01S_03_01850 [Flavihumibacter petaseus NBRC 106054]